MQMKWGWWQGTVSALCSGCDLLGFLCSQGLLNLSPIFFFNHSLDTILEKHGAVQVALFFIVDCREEKM